MWVYDETLMYEATEKKETEVIFPILSPFQILEWNTQSVHDRHLSYVVILSWQRWESMERSPISLRGTSNSNRDYLIYLSHHHLTNPQIGVQSRPNLGVPKHKE